jgi:hypothetical protein
VDFQGQLLAGRSIVSIPCGGANPLRMNAITPEIYGGFEPFPKSIAGWNGRAPIFGELISEIRPLHASHEYEDVIRDCREYWKILESGGVLFGDDWGWKSVRRAVMDFAKENRLTIKRSGKPFRIMRKL